MSLKQMVEMLSKGSAQAVTTLRTANANAAKLKDYLYVKTPVEKALIRILDETIGKRIVFLCGSSGDGKSEIFRRHHKKFSSKFDFHLDATHSFDPTKDAIQTLNDKFAEYKAAERPLLIGVNIGMLGNFAAEGDESHADVKTSINQFLSKQPTTNLEHNFINFEEYPKFEIVGDKVYASFVAPLLERICAKDDKNPIYAQSRSGNQETNLHRNYNLLCLPEVQQRICSLLFYAHLKFDQFLTARTVLDFVHQILTGKSSLFDNLFCGQGSELFDSLRSLDPCHFRSKELDLFQIRASTLLRLYDPEFAIFMQDVERQFGLNITEPRSWVRLFYVLQDADVSNNYHHRFRANFERPLFSEYSRLWKLHTTFDGSKQHRTLLRDFYQDTLLSGLSKFANRSAPEVKRDRLLLGKHNGYSVSVRAKLFPDFTRVNQIKTANLRHFLAFLKLEDHDLMPIFVGVNFLELLQRINFGYRPNTHDKTTVVMLEELLVSIRALVRETDTLHIQFEGSEWTLTNDQRNDEIDVE